MKYLIPIVLIVLTASVISCNIYNEVTVTKDETGFARYKTFAWLPDVADTANSLYNNEIIRNNLKNYFGKSFTDRGFKVDLNHADMLLQISLRQSQRELTVIHNRHPHTYYYCRYYYGSDYYSPYPFEYYNPSLYCFPVYELKQTISYVEGSITLNIIDCAQNRVIWSATAKGDIYDPRYINESIHPAVKAIMRKFPVKTIQYNRKADDINKNEDKLNTSND